MLFKYRPNVTHIGLFEDFTWLHVFFFTIFLFLNAVPLHECLLHMTKTVNMHCTMRSGYITCMYVS